MRYLHQVQAGWHKSRQPSAPGSAVLPPTPKSLPRRMNPSRPCRSAIRLATPAAERIAPPRRSAAARSVEPRKSAPTSALFGSKIACSFFVSCSREISCPDRDGTARDIAATAGLAANSLCERPPFWSASYSTNSSWTTWSMFTSTGGIAARPPLQPIETKQQALRRKAEPQSMSL